MTKDKVLAILKENDNYVSGEEISNVLHISRAAVNLAIKNLRMLGYEILSSTNKGYKLEKNPDLINKGEFINYIEDIDRLIVLDSIDSTNNYLKKLALDKAFDGQIVIADKQTKGRGRMGRSFYSSNGKGLYLSYLLKPKSVLPSITALVSVGICRAIERVYDIKPKIKWVNDIYLHDKKIAGILTETAIEGDYIQYMVIGIGINVNEDSFTPEISDIASSLYLETGKRINRSTLIIELIKELDIIKNSLPNDKGYYDEYVSNSMLIGKEVKVINGNMEKISKVCGIDENFGLILDDGTILNSGEVSIRKL